MIRLKFILLTFFALLKLILTFNAQAFGLVKFDKSFKELTSFAKWLMVKFYDVALRNKHLYLEVLFWKSSPADVYEIVSGYGSYETAEIK